MSFNTPTARPARESNGLKSRDAAPFSEAEAWQDVGGGWQPLFGSFRGAGYSIEWHDFFAKREFDWAASFHPGCVELCLNLCGRGFVESGGCPAAVAEDTPGFFSPQDEAVAPQTPPRPRQPLLPPAI